jgi:hypothetical protein
MKTTFLFGLGFLMACDGAFVQGTYPGGIVYGPKAAFPRGESWADARTVMYAKIAGTKFEDVHAFVAFAIKGMEKTHGKPKANIASGKTTDGHDYFINEYPATKNYSQWERIAYNQLPKAVAYIVFSARDEASYRKNFPALDEVLKSFAYMKIEGDHKQH